VGGFVVALVVFNSSRQPEVEKEVWVEQMTLGQSDAQNHFIVYTDMMCPYCDNFSRVIIDKMDELRRDYLDTGKIYLEYRMTDIIADHSVNSERAGEAAYCAATVGEFWSWYGGSLEKLWEDYHSKGIGTSKTAPKIPLLADEYWTEKLGDIDMGDDFAKCMEDHSSLAELNRNTARAAKILPNGVPYFVFNDFTSSGFEGDWARVKAMFQAGGVE
jgi:protein-disulfide isomerase